MSERCCGQRYEYDDRTCDLPAGHDDPDHHRHGSYHWLHHDEDIDALRAEGWSIVRLREIGHVWPPQYVIEEGEA